MINLKSPNEVVLMRRAGKLTAAARALAGEMVAPGITTKQIDKEVRSFIQSEGGIPAFLNYNGYPASICVSINEAVIHGIPSQRQIQLGDIVSIDVGVIKDGYVGDCADTFAAGSINDTAQRLITVTRKCFYAGIEYARAGYRISDISRAIENCAQENGYSTVRDFVGHGIGKKMHESPEVPNFYEVTRRRSNPRLAAGMTLAIEPMVNEGSFEVRVLDDGWTVLTKDGSLSAHYENTILITDGAPEVLTLI